MAQAYGSREHPVNLGPFSRIVEVHWKNSKPALAFAFRLRLERGFVGSGDDAELAAHYYSPLGSPGGPGIGIGVYHPDVFVPKDWGAWVLDDKHEWHSAQSYTIDGLPDFGPAPWYYIGSPVPFNGGASGEDLGWSVAGSPLDFTTPVVGQGDSAPRAFLSGPAVVVGAPGGETAVTFSTEISAVAGSHHYGYAGAVPLPFSIPGRSLIETKELIVLCLPVTA